MSLRARVVLRTLIHYKSFMAGIIIILFFIALSIYAAITWPYEEAITKWNNAEAWKEYPEWAAPAWIHIFTGKKEIDGALAIDSKTHPRRYVHIVEEVLLGGLRTRTVSLNFVYDYDSFPKSGSLKVLPVFTEAELETIRKVGVKVTLCKPSGINVTLYDGVVPEGGVTVGIYRSPIEHDIIKEYRRLLLRVYNITLTADLDPIQVLFLDDEEFARSNQTVIKPLKGIYTIVYSYNIVENLETVEIQLLLRGTVYGLFGTDYLGRDLFMGIAWGTPIALSFGLMASVITSLAVMIIAAIAAWFKGVVDETVSRVNEIFMILPFLPTLILISLFYGFTIWTLLGVVIALSVAGSGAVKSNRALFLQIREMPYIEAARAYGASSFRIIFRYMVPRVLPMLIPGIVTSVPSFVFLEAALAILGITDPRTITWGKILQEALNKQALFAGAYHWILAPAIALMLLAISFAMVGFTLDRVFNPRLRQL